MKKWFVKHMRKNWQIFTKIGGGGTGEKMCIKYIEKDCLKILLNKMSYND